MDANGEMVTMDASTGQKVNARPVTPPRVRKPASRLSKSSALSSSPTGTPLKPGVMQCPHCYSNQCDKSVVCSTCNGRLDGSATSPSPQSSPITQASLLSPSAAPEEGNGFFAQKPRRASHREHIKVSSGATKRTSVARASTSLMPEVSEAEGEANYMDLGVAKTEDQEQSSSDVDPTKQNYLSIMPGEKKGGSSKKKKKDKSGKQPKAVEIIVNETPNLVSILKVRDATGTEAGHSTQHIRFDEENISATRNDMAFYRGAPGRVDDIAWVCGYYLEGTISKTKQAAEKLRGANPGTFIVYDDPSGEDALTLTVMMPTEEVAHHTLTHSMMGLQFDGEGPYFKNLAGLVSFFCSENPTHPHLLALSVVQQEVVEEMTAELELEQVGHHTKLKEKEKVSKDMFKNTSAAADHTAQPWFNANLSRAEAVALVEFEPTGSFVVRENFDECGQFILTYVSDGDLYHVGMRPSGMGWCLSTDDDETDESQAFDSMVELIEFLATEEGAKNLECKLRISKPTPPPTVTVSTAIQDGPARGDGAGSLSSGAMRSSGRESHSAEKPAWLRLHVPKQEALSAVVCEEDGAFVVRSSETRKDCYALSYKFRNQICHDIIKNKGGKFCLNSNPNERFPSLIALVDYYSVPRPGFRIALRPSQLTTTSTATRAASLRASSKDAASPALQRQRSRGEITLQSQQSRGALIRSTSKSALLRSTSKTNLVPDDAGSKGLDRSKSGRRSARRSTAMESRVDQRAATSNWFCLNLPREEALARLPMREGAFVVRRATNGFGVLTLVCNSKLVHVNIEETADGLKLKKSHECQPNLSSLVAYYMMNTNNVIPRCLLPW
eukprot:m.7177 g.7177  ORF g.7177 m.7177 type:complete len:840 (-) comp5223_c1_seq1:560-3079(-)